MAAVLACGPGAVLSRTHAAALWEIRHAPSGPIHVTVPTTAGRTRRPGITLQRSSTLLTSQSTVRKAVPVTRPGRTLADLRTLLRADDSERTRSLALDHHLDVGSPGDGAVPSFSEIERQLSRSAAADRLPRPLGGRRVGGLGAPKGGP